MFIILSTDLTFISIFDTLPVVASSCGQSKAHALRHSKVDPVLKICATFWNNFLSFTKYYLNTSYVIYHNVIKRYL